MKLTFPRFGNTHIALRLFFSALGIEAIIPAANTEAGLERGAALSPGDICLPFKLMVGNLADAWQRGADTVILPTTAGPCRLGEYGELLKTVLDGAGMPFTWIMVESPAQIGRKEFLARLSQILCQRKGSLLRTAAAGQSALRLMLRMDRFEARAGEAAAAGAVPELHRALSACETFREAFAVLRRLEKYMQKKNRITREETQKNGLGPPVKILLTGEIFTLTEPFANRFLEEMLTGMGIPFRKSLNVTGWFRTLFQFGGGCPYMPCSIGGYAKETVCSVYRCRDADGAIQLLPGGCMPEIAAKSVLQEAGACSGIPVLSLIYDEMTGAAGMETRVEAFVDMLTEKRKKQEERRQQRNADAKMLYRDRCRFHKYRSGACG